MPFFDWIKEYVLCTHVPAWKRAIKAEGSWDPRLFELPRALDPRFLPRKGDHISTKSELDLIFSLWTPGRAWIVRAVLLDSSYALLSIAGVQLLRTTLAIIERPELSQLGLFFRSLGMGAPLLEPRAEGLLWCLLLFVVGGLSALARSHGTRCNVTGATLIDSAGVMAVFSRVLRLPPAVRRTESTGSLQEKVWRDVNDAGSAACYVSDSFATPIRLILFIVTLFSLVGAAGIAALLAILGAIGLSSSLGGRLRRAGKALRDRRSERVSLVTQTVGAIRVVKAFVLEKVFRERLQTERRIEVGIVRRVMSLEAALAVMNIASRVLVCLATFGAYTLLGHELSPSVVFTTLFVLKGIEGELTMINDIIKNLSRVRSSGARLLPLMRAVPVEPHPLLAEGERPGVALLFEGYTARYDDGEAPCLGRIDLEVARGEAVAVVGAVGSGKSSLFLALQNLLVTEGGRLAWGSVGGRRPRLGSASQDPFIMNASLGENISFGSGLAGAGELEAIVEACALASDVRAFERGLDTEIGENGLNLSGGQKARVQLARLAAQDPEVVLLDDPLSAVDHHTELELLDRLIFGLWKDRTRIVATHRLGALDRFDRVLFLREGRIVALGSHEELLEDCGEYADFVSHHAAIEGETGPTVAARAASAAASAVEAGSSTEDAEGKIGITVDETTKVSKGRRPAILVLLGNLMEETGLGRPLFIALLASAVSLWAVFRLLPDSWLAVWSGERGATFLGLLLAPLLGTSNSNLLIYVILSLGLLVCDAALSIGWMFLMTRLSTRIHDRMLGSLLGSPTRFFDSTPSGRIVNRFSIDLGEVDSTLGSSGILFLRASLEIGISTLFCLLLVPASAVLFPPVILLFLLLNSVNLPLSQAQRKFGATKVGTVLSLIKEGASGAQAIRAHDRTDYFEDLLRERLAANSSVEVARMATRTWYGIRTETLPALLLAGTAALVLAFRSSGGTAVAAVAGLALVYAQSVGAGIGRIMWSFNQCEISFVSYERCKEYTSLPAETPVVAPAALPAAAAWPTEGRVEFREVSLRYAEGLPQVLKGISFAVEGGMHAGIVGRTGCGKSTLFQALLRFVNIEAGGILIDGVDIASIPLERLRAAIAYIPQDPVLFVGTLRANLDPHGRKPDAAIAEALARAGLGRLLATADTGKDGRPGPWEGLDLLVQGSGDNLSRGERQLICLARAFLLGARIILLDEATANVDVVTDSAIQRILEEECRGLTVLTVAHRLGTLKGARRIVELSAGRVVSVGDR